MSEIALMIWIILLIVVIVNLFVTIDNKQEREELEKNNTILKEVLNNKTVSTE